MASTQLFSYTPQERHCHWARPAAGCGQRQRGGGAQLTGARCDPRVYTRAPRPPPCVDLTCNDWTRAKRSGSRGHARVSCTPLRQLGFTAVRHRRPLCLLFCVGLLRRWGPWLCALAGVAYSHAYEPRWHRARARDLSMAAHDALPLRLVPFACDTHAHVPRRASLGATPGASAPEHPLC